MKSINYPFAKIDFYYSSNKTIPKDPGPELPLMHAPSKYPL